MKKVLLGLGSIAAIAAPIAGVISCAKEQPRIVDIESKDITFIADSNGITGNLFNTAISNGLIATGTGSHSIELDKTSNKKITDYYDEQINAKKKLLVLPGYEHAKVLKAYATAHPKTKFVLIDSEVKAPNVASVVFNMREISFITGFLMAQSVTGETKHTIGMYGGAPIPQVSDYIDGVKKGIQYFNNHGKVTNTVVIEDKGFSGTFVAGDAESVKRANTLAPSSDLILSVGGPQYKDVLNAIKDTKTKNNSSAKLVGVDVDVSKSNPADKTLIWGTILKKLKYTTEFIVNEIKEDYRDHFISKEDPNQGLYTGNIDNEGTGLVFGGTVRVRSNYFGVKQEMFKDSNTTPENLIKAATEFSKIKKIITP